MPVLSFGRVAAVSVALFAMYAAGPAAAAGLLAPLSVDEARVNAAEGAPSRDPLVKRSRLVKLDSAELAAHIAPLGADTAPDRVERASRLSGVITIELFPDVVATFKRVSVDTIGDSGFAWVGNINGNPGEFTSLIVEDGEVTGHIQLGSRFFAIDPIRNGLHRVTELDPKRFQPDHPPGYRPQPVTAPGFLRKDAASPEAAATTVRVLAAYTMRSYQQIGTKAKMVTRIKQAISLSNTAYTAGNIPLKVVLAGAMYVGDDYVEWDNMSSDLAAVSGDPSYPFPGELANVRTKRTTAKADLVVLVHGSVSGCGVGKFTDNPSAGTSEAAYSVVNYTCISTNYSFHHEMGHNMGLRHDRFVDNAAGVGYNFGYVNKTNGCKVRDVMAYPDACASIGGCTRVNVFSSGTIKYTNGSKQCVMGIVKTKPNAADNVVRLKETRTAVGAYKN